MREILFKGKRKLDGMWVIGDLSQHKTGKKFIRTGSATHSFEVDENTICQYTGLTDKNGNKIWENDICTTDLERPYLIVEFRNGGFVYNCNDGGKDYYDIMEPLEQLVDSDKYTEVIGNIFDNHELLEGGAE